MKKLILLALCALVGFVLWWAYNIVFVAERM
jgi:hypothetical protein